MKEEKLGIFIIIMNINIFNSLLIAVKYYAFMLKEFSVKNYAPEAAVSKHMTTP